LGFNRVTGSAKLIPILKKIQNGVVLVKKNKKKQKSTGCKRVFDRVLLGQPTRLVGSYPIMIFLIFSSIQSRLTRRARPDFKTMSETNFWIKKEAWILLKETKMVKHVYPLCPPTS
jgi:hypothetical protein